MLNSYEVFNLANEETKRVQVSQVLADTIDRYLKALVANFLVQNLDDMIQSLSEIDEIDREETGLYAERNFLAKGMTEKYPGSTRK